MYKNESLKFTVSTLQFNNEVTCITYEIETTVMLWT